MRASTEDSDTESGTENLVDALMAASRALVAVAARSLPGDPEQVTLAQFRTLVVLATRGPQRPVDLAEALAVDPSTATRMCDRLVRAGLVRRQRVATDRRTVRVTLTRQGQELFDQVRARRRAELLKLLDGLPGDRRGELINGLRSLAENAGEPLDPARGWGAERAG